MRLADRRGVDLEVYEPAEDSSTLAHEATRHLEAGERVLDVGTGSGYVAERLRDEAGVRVVGSDVNPTACRRAARRGIPSVIGDVTTPFRDGVFDAVVFNPPYLPAVPGAAWSDGLDVALTGGETGRAVIERFLDDVCRVLTPDGVVLLLVSSATGVSAVVEYAAARGFSAAAVADVSFPGETLTVLKLVR